MAEVIVYGMVGNILSTLTSHAVREIGSVIGVKKELKKLESILSIINSILKDADEQQLINNHGMKGWIQNIKDVCYEAEDVVDEFYTESLRLDLKIRDSTFKKVRSFSYSIKSVSFHFKMSRRIKEIHQKFIEIEADKRMFHLIPRVVEVGVENPWREQTYSSVDESEVFGRDDDKNKLINLLSDGDEESVVAIVGMGGLGKTTLAQMVYGDEAIDQVFELKMWVGVYQDFNVKKILEKVIKSAINRECLNFDIVQLQLLIQEQFKGKKFLLVLDDVWNYDEEKWAKLKFVISSGAVGSKVVVTTRSINVANIMRAKQYILAGLSDNDCWNVFERRAFARGEEQADSGLVAIGKELVGRCSGVPLAAKTLASLMRLKYTTREWEAVRDSNTWSLFQNENDIMPTLRLSYNHLPIYLKRCFAYLGSYEMDSLYKKNDLIHSWIALGFVCSSSGDNRSLEDVGDDYVKELLWRSLIQVEALDKYGNLKSFKVHDLIHDMARDVGGTEYLYPVEGRVQQPEEIRYAKLHAHPHFEDENALCSMQNLRGLGMEVASPVEDIFSRLKCLRCLELRVTSERIPNSIGKLKHLRYLKLVAHRIKTLPSSITKLLSLRTLDLNCADLEELPQRINKMICLKHICIRNYGSLSYFPPMLKELTSLQTLQLFPVSKGVTGCTLNALKRMMSLGGTLAIENLENVKNSRDCAEVDLSSKGRLEVLKLLWKGSGSDDDDNNKKDISLDVLENLKPHPNLKCLKIEGYSSAEFSRWLMEPCLPKVVTVTLSKCGKCRYLPPFSQLPLLSELTVTDLEELQLFEVRVLQTREEWFPSLRTLCFERLPNLENWATTENEECLLRTFPSLVEVRVHGSPKLKTMPLLPSIEKIELCECSAELVHSSLLQSPSSSSMSTLKSLHIEECDDLEFLPNEGVHGLSSLESLDIESCPNLRSLLGEGLEGLEGLTSLLYLRISNCESFATLSAGMRHLAALQTLKLYKCSAIQSLVGTYGLASLQTLEIQELPKLVVLPELQNATRLSSLSLRGCEALERLPESLGTLTSLHVLVISSCPQLRSIPDGMRHLIALRELHISECDYLTSRCTEGTGEDWSKIAHVRYIKLNLKRVQ